MNAEVYLGLGTNLGDKERFLADGVQALGRLGSLVGASSLYRTAPIGGPKQDDYLNGVVKFLSSRTPEAVLCEISRIEKEAGRQRTVPNGPRTLDIDILLWDRRMIKTPSLTIPHPRLYERRFVLEPLAEIDPDLIFPDGTSIQLRLDAVLGQEVHRLWAPTQWIHGMRVTSRQD